MGKKLSTYYKDGPAPDTKNGHCEIHISYKDEMFYIKYFDDHNRLFFTEEFPGKSMRYVEDAAENRALGIKKLENI